MSQRNPDTNRDSDYIGFRPHNANQHDNGERADERTDAEHSEHRGWFKVASPQHTPDERAWKGGQG